MNKFPRWLAAILVLAVALILAAGAWFYRDHGRHMRREVEQHLEIVAALKTDQIAAWRAERLADAAVLVENRYFVQEALRCLADSDDQAAEQILTRFSTRKHYHYRDVVLVDADGRVRLSLTGGADPLHQEGAEALAAAFRRRKPVFTDIHLDAQARPHIGVVAPILAGNWESARPVGAVILQSDAQQFLYPLIQTWPGPETTAETLLVRRDGDEVLFLNELRHQPDAALNLRLPLTRTDVPAVMAVLGREGVGQGLDYRGVEVLAALKPVPDSPWFMVSKIDAAEALAGWRFQAALIAALFLALAAFAAAAVFVVWQRNAKAHYRTMFQAEAARRKIEERFHTTLMSVGDGIIAADAQGRIEFLNPAAQTLTGWSQEEARGRPVDEVFRIVNEETRQEVENPVTRVLREGLVVGLANHTLLIARDGTERPIADSGAPIRDESGAVDGVVLVFRDQTEERAAMRLTETRMKLIEYAATHTMDEFMTKALDEIGELVDSPIGFYHFVESDQKTISLQQWSTRTLKEFCQAEGKGSHYPIDQAGVWADCARERKPVIHNDYDSLKHKKGMPAGHAKVTRELTVPVMRKNKVVAILGVGEKPVDYTDKDVGAVAFLADVTWEIVERKRAEEALHDSEKRYRRLFESAKDGILILEAETGKVVDVNPFLTRLLGYSFDSLCGKHLWEIGSFKDIAASKSAFEALQSNEYIRYEDLPLETKDGRLVDVEFVSNVYLVDHAKVVQCNIRDITERKKAEEALRQSEEDYRQLFEAESDAIFLIDNETGRILQANQAACDMYGYSREEILAKRNSDLSAEPEETRQITQNTPPRPDQVVTVPLRWHRKKDGTVFPVEITARFFIRDGRPFHIAAIRDITERKKAEETLRRRLALESFLADFSARCIDLPPGETDAAVNQALEGIGALTDVDRSYVFLLDDQRRTMTNTHEWCAPGIEPQKENLQDLPWDIFPWWMDKLGRFETIYIPRTADLPPEAAAEKKILEDQDIRSVLVVPIAWRQKLTGFLGFDSGRHERTWTAEDRQTLETMANTLAMVFEHQRADAERERLQAQLLQAHKMEAVGRLAGGVAHDFNNMLQVILGRTEMALGEIDLDSPLHQDLQEILKAAEHSADLTRQLLAFARKQTINPKVLDLNDTVSGMLKMLRRLIGEDIDLAWMPGHNLGKVKIDPAQIDQILANLMVNARDAIDGVGRVTIETENVAFDQAYCADHPGFVPGQYVLLAVSDDGRGMDKDILDKIFEPFFTTKGVGRGTGLGLATIYGIVKQNEGFINVYSEPGQGATFRIYLPRFPDEAVEAQAAQTAGPLRGGTETVLLVEDEETILNLGRTILEGLGYRVLTAGAPSQAVRLAEEHPGAIDLLITDVVMPEMNGRDLAEKIKSIRPELKCLFMSGYTANVIVHRGVLAEGVRFIQKPFSMRDLAEKVRQVLDQD